MLRNLTAGLVLYVFLLTSCGDNQRITVSPPSADAQNFPNGIVQFSAVGVSSPTWCIGSRGGVCNGNIVSLATVDATGRAQCLGGHTGTVTILAGVGIRSLIPDTGAQLSTFGSAQLTCP